MSKTIQSWDAAIIEDWEIEGFRDVDDEIYKSQISIAKILISKGIIEKTIKH